MPPSSPHQPTAFRGNRCCPTCKTATAAIAALSLAAAMPAPTHLGEKEQNALAAIVAAGVIGTVIMKENRAPEGRPGRPRPMQTVPSYYRPRVPEQPRYDAPRYAPAAPSGIYATPAARAFNSYSASQRRTIQSRLAQAGYNGGIDGAFGPMTHRAVTAIAGDSTGTAQLDSLGGAYEFYDTILG